MAASHGDSYFLSQDATFQNRVAEALFQACVNIGNEGWAVIWHRERANFAAQVLSNTNVPNPYIKPFASSVATDPTVLSDATQAGTVVLTSGNAAAQAALATDAHIDNAISAQFNSYLRLPGV